MFRARAAPMWWMTILGLLLAACTHQPRQARPVLDPATGVSFTVVDTPLILARERRDVAANARDYLTLVAAEINDAGRRQLVWVVHQWSTIDARAAPTKPGVAQDLLLVADGRDLLMKPLSPAAVAPYDRPRTLLRPEDAEVVTTIYRIDSATLEYVATSARIEAAYPDSFALPFALWRDGRPALLRLLGTIAAAE